MKSSNLPLLIVAGVGLLLISGGALAFSGGETQQVVVGYEMDDDGNVILDDDGNPIPIYETVSTGSGSTTGVDVDAQTSALLATIRQFESGGDYNILYGGAPNTYGNSDHPSFLGWPGVVLPTSTCVAAGYANGVCKTTAAGAYQFLSTSWRTYAPAAAFTPANQDAAALRYLTALGAITALQSGDVNAAFAAASKAWASMPYSASGQPKQSLSTVLAAFESFGGTVA